MQALVADDDPVCCKLASDLVAACGFEVRTVPDGAAAMEALQGPQAPPLVVLDWSMPRMDGFEVCRAVRSMPRGDQIYILLVTARADRRDLLKVVLAGADDYLTKPFDPSDFKIRLRTAARIIYLQRELASLRGVAMAAAGKETP